MKMNHILREIWYGIYYAVAPNTVQEYALTCKEAVSEINTKKDRHFRVKLHLSLCQACTNYDKYSRWLSENFPEKKSGSPVDLSNKIFARIRELEGKND